MEIVRGEILFILYYFTDLVFLFVKGENHRGDIFLVYTIFCKSHSVHMTFLPSLLFSVCITVLNLCVPLVYDSLSKCWNQYIFIGLLNKTSTWKPWARRNWITSTPIFFIKLLMPVLFEKHFKAPPNVSYSI